MTPDEYRAAPPFARYVALASWLAANPLPPTGYKACNTCGGHMLARDRHARCQLCRNAGGYLRKKYTLTCRQCGNEWLASKTTRIYCSTTCMHKAQRKPQ